MRYSRNTVYGDIWPHVNFYANLLSIPTSYFFLHHNIELYTKIQLFCGFLSNCTIFLSLFSALTLFKFIHQFLRQNKQYNQTFQTYPKPNIYSHLSSPNTSPGNFHKTPLPIQNTQTPNGPIRIWPNRTSRRIQTRSVIIWTRFAVFHQSRRPHILNIIVVCDACARGAQPAVTERLIYGRRLFPLTDAGSTFA